MFKPTMKTVRSDPSDVDIMIDPYDYGIIMRRYQLWRVHDNLTTTQQAFFKNVFRGTPARVSDNDLNKAIRLCQRTITANKETTS